MAEKQMCEGKVKHATARAANSHMRSLNSRSHFGMNVYHCNTCKGYHIGHTDMKKKPGRKFRK